MLFLHGRRSDASRIGKRGFTLTEISVVMGIIGIMLGAIWTAASKVYANNRVARASSEIIAIANGVRALYPKGYFTSAGDLTSTLASMGTIYPPDMLLPAGCPAASFYYSVAPVPCPVDPWGSGAVQVGAMRGWYGAPVASNNFTIMFWDSSVQDCPAVMAQMIGPAAGSAGVTFAYAAGAASNAHLATPATASIADALGCTGMMTFGFTL